MLQSSSRKIPRLDRIRTIKVQTTGLLSHRFTEVPIVCKAGTLNATRCMQYRARGFPCAIEIESRIARGADAAFVRALQFTH